MFSLFRFLFFGNVFYGVCVLALAIESSLQQGVPINSATFYLLLFFSTLLYYNLAFSKIDANSLEDNPRLNWHQKHLKDLGLLQVFYFILILCLLVQPLQLLIQKWSNLRLHEVVLLLLFPIVSVLYYGINTSGFKTGNLRNIGWLKPFLIGFTWAGVVGILPQLYFNITQNTTYSLSGLSMVLFIKNFLFISVLSIMFDIKDYAKDYNYELKTFVVQFGLRKTIYFILIPLLLIAWISFFVYGLFNQYSWMRIFLNTLPFLLCITVALELQKRKSIYFYLVIIDGLMLVKALCGTVAILYF